MNDSFADMIRIMEEIKLSSHVNGIHRNELYGLAHFKPHYCDSAIYLDVGTNMGNSAIIMASAIKHQGINIPSLVYTVDNYCESKTPEKDMETARRNMSSFGIDHLLSIHVSDALEFINSLKDESIDMVFDDASHDYLSTYKRLNAYIPKMKKNSLIAGHDYYVNFHTVVKAVEDFRRNHSAILSSLTGIPGMFWMFCKLEA